VDLIHDVGSEGNDMNGLGRFLAMQSLNGEEARRDADDEWRAQHRRPDAAPLPDDQDAIVTSHRRRVHEGFRLRRLIARFSQH
jgi:hypothetical protein